MSQNFRSRVDELLDNDPTSASEAAAEVGQSSGNAYASHGSVRNLCFVWEDGRRVFLNYAYLVSGEYRPSDRTILLSFTTHEVVLKGVYLDVLFDALIGQVARVVASQDARYNAAADKSQPRVNTIELTKLA